MNNELLHLVKTKECLVILADREDTVVWSAKTRPHDSTYFFFKRLAEDLPY